MIIGIFTDHFYPELGGIQDSIAELARELGRRGHEVDIWAPRASRANFSFVGLPPQEIDLGARVRIHRVPSVGIPSSSLQSRLASPFFRLRKKRYDVVHVHSFLGIGYRGLRVAKRAGVPLVGTNHWAIVEFADYVPWFFAGLFRAASIRYVTWFYNQCALTTAPSRIVLAEKQAHGFRAPCRVVSNPIDTAAFKPPRPEVRQALRAHSGFAGPVIACVGRIAPEKKTDIVLKAFAELCQQVPDALLVFGGHGSFEEEMKALARRLGVQTRVRFLGTLTKRGVAELYQAADLYAIASVSETQSMSLIQAFAAGLPAVGVRWRAIPEYLNDERGLLFERDDYREMAAHLAMLSKDALLRARLGARATAFAQQFSTSAIGDQWEHLYQDLIDASTEPRPAARRQMALPRSH